MPSVSAFFDRRLVLLAALAAILAAAALAIPRADAQTPPALAHIVQWDFANDRPVPLVNGRYDYNEGSDIYIKVWVVASEQTAGEVPPSSALTIAYQDYEALVIGYRTNAPPADGATSPPSLLNGGDHRIGFVSTADMSEYGFQKLNSDTPPVFANFDCPAHWDGPADDFGTPCGAGFGENLAEHASLLDDTALAATEVADSGGVFKLVIPDDADLDNFYLSGVIREAGSNYERAIRFVSPDYREVSVYRIKDTDDGFAPCTSADTSVDDCTSDANFGRAILVGSTLTKGTDGDGDPIKVSHDEFDMVQVKIQTNDELLNAGVVFHPDLCPISSPPLASGVSSPFQAPQAPQAPSRSGNDQLGLCTYNQKSFSDTSGDYDGTVGPFVAFTAFKGGGMDQTDGMVYVSYRRGGTEIASGQYEFNSTGGRRADVGTTTDVQEGWAQGRIGAYGSSGDLALRIGVIWDSSSPESAIDGDYITTEHLHQLAGGDARLSLTVKGKGTVRLLGTDWECSDDGPSTGAGTTCNLNNPAGADADAQLARLRDAMLGGRPLSTGYTVDPMHITPLILRVVHDTENPEDIIISGQIKHQLDATWDNPIPEYTAKVDSATGTGEARVIAWLPDDADGRLGPGQRAQVAVGYHAQDTFEGRFHGSVSGFWYATAYEGLTATFGSGIPTSIEKGFGDGYLVLNGPAVWSESGGKRLRLNAENYNYIKCVDRKTVTGSNDDEGQASCYMANSSGAAPTIRVDADAGDADITVTGNVPVWSATADGDATSLPETGTTIPFYAMPTNQVKYQGVMAFGQDRLRVGAVRQIETVTLSRKPGPTGIVPSGTIRVGSTTPENVLLSIRNAENAPSQITAISAITISVIGGGGISSAYCPSGNLKTCTVNLDTTAPTGEGRESLRLKAGEMPSVINAIPISFKAPDSAGNTRIVATVIGLDGSTFAADPLQLVISGSASSVAVTGDEPRLLSFDTPDAGDDKDDRDTSSIRIAASDASGNAAEMPRNAQASLKQADGTAVASSAYVATIECTDADRTNCSLVININQAAASPLASGGYVVTVSGSGITDLEVPITLAGKAKTINVELGDLPGVGQNWPITIAVLDADGTPVADGTQLTLNARGVAAATSDVVLISKPNENSDGIATAKTKNGMLSATLTVIARGRGVLSVSAVSGSGDSQVTDATAGGVVLDTRTAALPDEAYGGPVAFQSADGMPAVGVISRWRSATAGSAAQALAIVADADVLWLHNGRAWIQYATGEDGATLPGSAPNFTIVEGDYLWFASTQ